MSNTMQLLAIRVDIFLKQRGSLMTWRRNDVASGLVRKAVMASAMLLPGVALADFEVGAVSISDLAGGRQTLGCTDLIVYGTLVVGAGGSVVEARNVIIAPGGKVQLAGGAIELAGEWRNQGSVTGPGSVTRVATPGCPLNGQAGPIAYAGEVTAVPAVGAEGLGLLGLAMVWFAARMRRRPARRDLS